MISRKQLIVILIMIALSPLFGVYLANLVGYHEPLDVAGDLLHLKDIRYQMNWTPFIDYTVPGLPDMVGYAIAGVMGFLIILGIGYAINWYVNGRRGAVRRG